jgi:hypothetical protein
VDAGLIVQACLNLSEAGLLLLASVELPCCTCSGMICPHVVNWSMLLGAILSWGLMWPLMKKKEGYW